MRDIAEDITARGATLTLVGTGTPEQGADFAARLASPFRVLVDPDLNGYRALELRERLFGGFGLKTTPRFFRIFFRGFRPHGIQGNPHQLGGVFVITPDQQLRYSYLSRTTDDRVEPSVLLEVLDTLSKSEDSGKWFERGRELLAG